MRSWPFAAVGVQPLRKGSVGIAGTRHVAVVGYGVQVERMPFAGTAVIHIPPIK